MTEQLQSLTENDLREIKALCKEMRKDIVTMIHGAKSGHPGGNLSAVEIMAVLYKKCMNICPDWKNSPDFEKRDRFYSFFGQEYLTITLLINRKQIVKLLLRTVHSHPPASLFIRVVNNRRVEWNHLKIRFLTIGKMSYSQKTVHSTATVISFLF